jgi:CheY-like chemotaxis protein
MITGYLRDITDRIRVEQERARLLEAEQQARVRAEDLAEDLREQQKAKDRFLAMLGHELRNPLAPIVNGLEILRQRGGSAEAQQLYEMMSHQLRHMARLLDDLLDMSRVQHGTIAMQFERVNLVDVARHAAEACRSLLDERQHRFRLDLPDAPCWIDGDPTRLEQIIANLLVNAARYTPPGGELGLSLHREDGDALLCVRDNGIGIRRELLAQIFEPFRQADRVAGNAQHGLGIGLTLAKKLAELHGGSIRASSEGNGLGSEFLVRLPLSADEGSQPGPVDSVAPRGRSFSGGQTKHRILVVDDNKESADTLALLLSLSGHATEVAYDGPEALEKSRSFHPDFALIDIELPKGMNGYELGKRLLEDAGAQRPVLVAVPGYGKLEDRERSRAVGFDYHLVKPVDPHELERVLQMSPQAG